MKRIIAVLLLLLASSVSFAADWPAWRGPTGQGFCAEAMPLKWSKTENVRWTVPLAHQGNSTPVVWGDRIFLTQANKGGTIRSLLCFARADGKLLWQRDVNYALKETNWTPDWYANASPALDEKRVVVSFASAGMYCFDHDGKELWKRTDLGNWQHAFGNASSPILYDNLAILWCGPNCMLGKEKATKEAKPKAPWGPMGRNFLLAVDKNTGKTVWEHDEKNGSWGTPLVTKINEQDQLLLSTVPHLVAIEPKSGQTLWSCNGLTKFAYTSPLYGNGVAVAMSGFHGDALAVKLGNTGDITKDRLWQQLEKPDKIPQRVGSGMIIGDYVYMVEESGQPRCWELRTGKEVWQAQARPAGITWGSMVHSNGQLYVLMRNAETLVLAASPKYEVLAINSLDKGEQSNSSLAVSNGDVFIRTFKHLWCIREKK
jgi:outer membrane protein assembly factor BamB